MLCGSIQEASAVPEAKVRGLEEDCQAESHDVKIGATNPHSGKLT